MTIGTLGNVAFFVSRKKVQTIQSMKWKKTYTYATHKLVGRKGLLEYTGSEPDEIDLDMEISIALGISPMKVIKKINKMADSQKAVKLILGNDVIGNKWVITEHEVTADKYFRDGTMLAATLKVKIKEYPEE